MCVHDCIYEEGERQQPRNKRQQNTLKNKHYDCLMTGYKLKNRHIFLSLSFLIVHLYRSRIGPFRVARPSARVLVLCPCFSPGQCGVTVIHNNIVCDMICDVRVGAHPYSTMKIIIIMKERCFFHSISPFLRLLHVKSEQTSSPFTPFEQKKTTR